MLYAILILVVLMFLYIIWITSVLYNMIQGLDRKEEDSDIYMGPGPD